MKVLILRDKTPGENRVALTPELIAKYGKIGYEVLVEEGCGERSGIKDADYEKSGARIIKKIQEVVSEIDVLLTVNAPENDTISILSGVKKGAVLVGMLNPYSNQDKTRLYQDYHLSAFACELFPRISRAQSIDVLSSQSNLAGYRAVIEAVYELNIAVPMMMTAAGTISPAKIMILGAGVAGLQAIATAKRLGGVVTAFDVRVAAKEQVESLGAKFIEVISNSQNLETSGGYAKEVDEDYKKRQEKAIYDNIINQDIVITTALIPGKPAPRLITKAMVENMKPGAVIVDMAASSGGNCELTSNNQIVNLNGVKIIGYGNLATRIARDASKLYARNLYNFIELITNKEKREMVIDREDEIIKSSLL